MSKQPCAVIIGGTSGLGEQLAGCLNDSHRVICTGRQSRFRSGEGPGEFFRLDLTPQSEHVGWRTLLDNQYRRLLRYVGQIDLLVFAAGFYQEKPLEELTDEQIMAQYHVGPLSYQLLVRRILKQQESLIGHIVITSTSALKARLNESGYCASKAALNQVARCVGLSPKVGKTLIVAPGGMNTGFYRNSDRDTSNFLDPADVADLIHACYAGYAFELCTLTIPRPALGGLVCPTYTFEEQKSGTWNHLFQTRNITPEISNFIASIG